MFRNLKAMSIATTGLLVMSLAALSIGVQSGGVAAAAAKSKFVIGVPLPMTGAEAASGNEIFKAEELAASQINAAGGVLGHKVVLVEEDSACDATTAANAANLLVTKHVNAIVGSTVRPTRYPRSPSSAGPACRWYSLRRTRQLCSLSATRIFSWR